MFHTCVEDLQVDSILDQSNQVQSATIGKQHCWNENHRKAHKTKKTKRKPSYLLVENCSMVSNRQHEIYLAV